MDGTASLNLKCVLRGNTQQTGLICSIARALPDLAYSVLYITGRTESTSGPQDCRTQRATVEENKSESALNIGTKRLIDSQGPRHKAGCILT